MTPEDHKEFEVNNKRGQHDRNGHYDIDGFTLSDTVVDRIEESEMKNKMEVDQQETPEVSFENGIGEEERMKMAHGLSKFLANTYTLYLKTQNFHWNVTGPSFRTLHLLFEQQYQDLATAVDLIAERIRSLGMRAPGTFSEFLSLADIQEKQGVVRAEDMIVQLIHDQDAIASAARSLYSLADKINDDASADILTKRMQIHEKNAWMLRSLMH